MEMPAETLTLTLKDGEITEPDTQLSTINYQKEKEQINLDQHEQ